MYHPVPVWEFWHCPVPSCTVLYQLGRSCTCLYCLVPSLPYLVLAGTVLYSLVPTGEILYLLVPSCSKLRNLALPCTILYRLEPIGEFLYLLVLVQTGTYQYRPVRSNLPVYVQVYRIPDVRFFACSMAPKGTCAAKTI